MHTSKVKKTSLCIYTVRKSYQLLYISFLDLCQSVSFILLCLNKIPDKSLIFSKQWSWWMHIIDRNIQHFI